MIRRRAFLIGAGVLLAPAGFAAQLANGTRRVGLLAQDLQPGLLETFRDQLQRLGYVAGRNVRIEVRNAEGRSDRLPALIADLLRLNVEVVVAVNTPAAKAAQTATRTVPIVILRVADPVKAQIIRSLAHPGGNVTGLSFMPDVLGAKAIEALRQTVPTVSHMAAFYKADNPGAFLVVTETERRIAAQGVRFEHVAIRNSGDIPAAFARVAQTGAQGIFVMDDGAMTKLRGPLLKEARGHSLPVVSIYQDFAEAGGLFAYGPDLNHVYRRAAHYVDRILKGARPGELPVEQPEIFHFAINLKTAKALGLTIPPSLLLQADQVIQ